METSVKKCKVTFIATTPHKVDALYLCGEPHNAGCWDADKAAPMKLTDEGWRVVKVLPVGEEFEFKILNRPDWHGVEKGTWGEEIPNHCIVAEKGLVVRMTIPNFRLD